MNRHSPRTRRMPPEGGRLAEVAAPLVEARLKQVESALKRLAEAPADEAPQPEAVHGLRVAVRRAVASLDCVKECLEAEGARRARRVLRKLRRAAGTLRACDVNIGLINADLRSSAGELRSSLAGLRDRIEGQRLAALRDLREFPLRRAARRVKQLRHELVDGLAESQRRDGDVGFETAARAGISAQLAEVCAAAAVPLTDPDRLHQLRIRAKKLRYMTEIFALCFDERRLESVKTALIRMQDLLGAANDIFELSSFAGRLAKADAAPPMIARGVASGRGPNLDAAARHYAARYASVSAEFEAWWRFGGEDAFVRAFEGLLDSKVSPVASPSTPEPARRSVPESRPHIAVVLRHLGNQGSTQACT